MNKNHNPIRFAQPMPLAGAAVCSACGLPTRNASAGYCLSCLMRQRNLWVFPPAVDARFRLNEHFCPAYIARYLETLEKTGYNMDSYKLNYSIIKACEHCEQVRNEIQTIGPQYIEAPTIQRGLHTTHPPITRRAGGQEIITKLFTEMVEVVHSQCAYCGKVVEERFMHLDCLIPLPFDHSHLDDSTKLLFYQILRDAGILMVACGRCNMRKGVLENRGLSFLREIAKGNLVSSSQIEVTRRFPFVPPYIKPEHSRAGHMSERQAGLLRRFLPLFGLRVVSLCPHVLQKWWFVSYDPEVRTIYCGCERCIRHPLLAVNQGKRAESYERTVLPRKMKKYEPYRGQKLRETWGDSGGMRKGYWIPWRDLNTHQHIRPEHETHFESLKMLHEQFHFPAPPPLAALDAHHQARAADADAEFLVLIDMRRLDGVAEVARQLETTEIKRREKNRLKYGDFPAGGNSPGACAQN